MSTTKEETRPDRRSFLKALSVGAAGATAVAGLATPVEAVAAESASDKRKKRYRETDHVKAFYRTNRY